MAQLELVDRQSCRRRAPKFVDGASRTVYNSIREGWGKCPDPIVLAPVIHWKLVEIRAQRFELDVRNNVTEFHDHKRGGSFQKLLELDAFCNY